MNLENDDIKANNQLRELQSLLRSSLLFALPVFIFIISIFFGLGVRDVLTNRVENFFGKKGNYQRIDQVGLKNYLLSIKNKRNYNLDSYPPLKYTFKNKDEWNLELLQSSLKEFLPSFDISRITSPAGVGGYEDKDFIKVLSLCEVLDFAFCFKDENFSRSSGFKSNDLVSRPQTRTLLNISSADKEIYNFFIEHKTEYIKSVKIFANQLLNESFLRGLEQVFDKLAGSYSRSLPYLKYPGSIDLSSRARKLLKINKENHFLLGRDFQLPNEKVRNTPLIRAYLLENGYLKIDNLTDNEIVISHIVMGKKELVLNLSIPASSYYSYPSSKLYSNDKVKLDKKGKVFILGAKEPIGINSPYSSNKLEKINTYTLSELKNLGFQISNNEIRFSGRKLRLTKAFVNNSTRKIFFDGPLTISFGEGSYLYSKGALITGDKGRVIFKTYDKLWGGILISEGSERSIIKNTIFESISAFSHNNIVLTGAINFYNTNVFIQDSNFKDNQSEDMLNIINSKFELKNVSIVNTPSDAFDSDFSTGTIENSHFEKVGGDGFDVSGTLALVSNSTFLNIKDKAISVGEASDIKSSSNSISNVGTAIASKDQSTAIDNNSTFENVKHSVFATYVKKPEYGVAKIIVDNPTFKKVTKVSLVQNGSTLILNGKNVIGEDVDIKQIYQSGYMKK